MVYLASKTKSAINLAIESDQGAKFREWLGKVIPAMGDAFNPEYHPFRSHMGASGIGDVCDRKIWLGHKWVTRPKHSGRMIRLFNRGHLEEARFIAMLLMIGCEVYQQDSTGKQFKISGANGHFGGSGDGVGKGIPDLDPNCYFLLECKTHSKKSFDKLTSKGVHLSKPMHYTQMQVYMRKMQLEVGLYFACCKDDDEIYLELVKLDIEHADRYLNRAEGLVSTKTIPIKLYDSPQYFECKYCDHVEFCHLGKSADVNCRTCKYSSMQDGGKWHCGNKGVELTTLMQFDGCSEYEVRECLK